MGKIIPLKKFIAREWYPGNKTGSTGLPFYAEPPRLFSKKDEKTFWILDFHWPRGLSPMGSVFLEDCDAFAAQEAAEKFAIPPTRGMMHRWVGPHVYKSQILVESPWEIQRREQRFRATVAPFLENFSKIWQGYTDEIMEGLKYFEEYNLEKASFPEELRRLIEEARNFHKRCWQIHFEVMYPLSSNYVAFRQLAIELGIESNEVPKMLQGYDTKFVETDKELWRLARLAKQLGLQEIFLRKRLEQIPRELEKNHSGKTWLQQFATFMAIYGWRTEGISDIMLPSWIEDSTPPLGNIKTFLMRGTYYDFDASRKEALEVRERTVQLALQKIANEEDRKKFTIMLEVNRKANFAWWNDEHNFYIDLRATIPLRRICLEIGKRLAKKKLVLEPDDTLFMFYPELIDTLEDPKSFDWNRMRRLVKARKKYYYHWRDKRSKLPKLVGAVPTEVTDPVFIEIFGIHHAFLESIRHEDEKVEELIGVPASQGVAEGRARVLHTAEKLHEVLPNEILVCEATSPNWTPAFTKIAACVCDGGGTLTHAAIISREYGIPCVVGTAIATKQIKNGQMVRVDGTKGTVRIYK